MNYTAVSIEDLKEHKKIFIISNNDASKESKHSLKIEEKVFEWKGPFLFN